jgi:outer membrane protein TolC
VDAARDSVIAKTANAYFELTKVRHSLEYLRKDRESAQKMIDAIHQRVASGFELPIEETRAQLSASRVEQQIAHNEGREEALQDQLRDMLGLVPDQPLELVDEALAPPPDQPVSELVSQAVQNDPGIKRAEAEQRAKEQLVKGAEGARWPTLALVGTYSVLTKANNYTDFFNKFQRNNVNFGVQAQIPIYGAHANAAVNEARADLTAATLEVRSKRIQVEQQVKSQAHLVREMEASRDVAQWDLKLAQQNQGVVQAQFDQGRATLQELGRAQLDENDKWLAFLDADFQRQRAQLALLQMTGQIAKVLR